MPNCSTAAAWRCWSFAGRAEALEAFDRLLASMPGHRDALGNRANALLRLNRVAEARGRL